nr:hypothetical protein [Sulfurimonas sp. SAG-AH-194-C20]
MSNKKQLIKDIQQLLNSHENIPTTKINPNLLEFMDEETLINIIGSLLDQKETHLEADNEWLEQFKKDKNS